MNALLINGAAHPSFPPPPPPVSASLIAHKGAQRMTRDELALLPVPVATKSHVPIPFVDVVTELESALRYRHITIVKEEFAATPDGGRMFGVLEINSEFHGCRCAIGIRNSNDKSFRLSLTIGYRVFVCDNLSFSGQYTPVLTKHSNSVNLTDLIDLGVARMQRNFEPLQKQIETWQTTKIEDDEARLIIYQAYIGGDLKLSPRLMKPTHDAYFKDDRFEANTFWRLSNAFTSAFKKLDDPIRQYQATARLGAFLHDYHP